MSDSINTNGSQEPRIPYAADPLAYYQTDPKPANGSKTKPVGGDDYHCTPLRQEDANKPRLVQKRLRSLLGKEFKGLTDLTIRLWNEPAIEDHHVAIIDLVNAGETTKLAAYLTNITKFTQHRARVDAVRSKIRSPNPQVRASVQRTIDEFKDSNDPERRAFGARLEKAVHALDTLSEPRNQPRPLNLTGRGYGFDVWEVPFRIAAESRMMELFQDDRFQGVWQKEYKKTDEYKAVERRIAPFRRVSDADAIVTDLKSKDPKVRAKAYGALVTKIRLAGGKTTDDGVVALSQATVLLTHDRTLHMADRDALKALHETPPQEPMISVRTVDDDASDDDRRIQAAEAREESARMKRNQDAYDHWKARHDSGMAIVGGLHAKFEKRLDAAKPESKMVKRIAASERKSERRALVKDMRLKAKDMRDYNPKDADRVVKLAGQIEAETDYKKLMALHERGSFIAQTGFMLAQIRGLREVQSKIEGQKKKDGKTAYWAARASTLFLWRPDMPNIDSNLGVTLDAAERALLRARRMYDTGEIKRKPKYFAYNMKRVQKLFGKISKAIKEDQDELNSAEASFMRTSVGFGIIAAAVLASSVTGGLAGAVFGQGMLAASATLLISGLTFTAVQTAGNHYIMGQDVTWGSFGEDLFWNTMMFGVFGKLGKWLKVRAGIHVAKQGARTSVELLARIPARYGMKGMKLTGVNILKLSGQAVAKELGVLAAEAAGFQVFEATKLTVRAMGISAHPVDHYVKELRKLFTMKSLAHGMGNLAAIRGVGYGSGKVMQGAIEVRVKFIRADVSKMIGVLKDVRLARAKGRKTISPQAEAEVAARLFHQVATLCALSGGKPGSFAKSAFALARDASVRAQEAGVGDVARSLGAHDVKGFEAAVQRLPETEQTVVVQKLIELDASLKTDGKLPGASTRVKMFLLRGMLKRMGFGLNGRGKLVPYEVAARERAAAGQRGMVTLPFGKGSVKPVITPEAEGVFSKGSKGTIKLPDGRDATYEVGGMDAASRSLKVKLTVQGSLDGAVKAEIIRALYGKTKTVVSLKVSEKPVAAPAKPVDPTAQPKVRSKVPSRLEMSTVGEPAANAKPLLVRKPGETSEVTERHGNLEFVVFKNGEGFALKVRAVEGELVRNGKKFKDGEWKRLKERDTVVIDGTVYARSNGALRPITVGTKTDKVLMVEKRKDNGSIEKVPAAGAESYIIQNADGNLTKVGRITDSHVVASKLNVEQQALTIIEANGIDVAPRVVGRPAPNELIMTKLPGRTLNLLSRAELKQIPEQAWDALKRDVEQLQKLGITHSDIHEGNIIYDAKAQKLRLLDFDRARVGVRSKQDMADFGVVRAAVKMGTPWIRVKRITIYRQDPVSVAPVSFAAPASAAGKVAGPKKTPATKPAPQSDEIPTRPVPPQSGRVETQTRMPAVEIPRPSADEMFMKWWEHSIFVNHHAEGTLRREIIDNMSRIDVVKQPELKELRDSAREFLSTLEDCGRNLQFYDRHHKTQDPAMAEQRYNILYRDIESQMGNLQRSLAYKKAVALHDSWRTTFEPAKERVDQIKLIGREMGEGVSVKSRYRISEQLTDHYDSGFANIKPNEVLQMVVDVKSPEQAQSFMARMAERGLMFTEDVPHISRESGGRVVLRELKVLLQSGKGARFRGETVTVKIRVDAEAASRDTMSPKPVSELIYDRPEAEGGPVKLTLKSELDWPFHTFKYVDPDGRVVSTLQVQGNHMLHANTIEGFRHLKLNTRLSALATRGHDKITAVITNDALMLLLVKDWHATKGLPEADRLEIVTGTFRAYQPFVRGRTLLGYTIHEVVSVEKMETRDSNGQLKTDWMIVVRSSRDEMVSPIVESELPAFFQD